MTTTPLAWDAIDTVLLDMDGTLIDLRFDNVFWNEYVPKRYAEHHGVDATEARRRLHGMFADALDATERSLAFYCLDHWSEITGLDIVQEKDALKHLIRYRADAEAFLSWLHRSGKRIVMVTNAHRGSFDLKHNLIGVGWYCHRIISSHDYREAKESPAFWEHLRRDEGHEPARSLLVDDNLRVLDTARAAGIGHLLCISTPDSERPARDGLPYPAVDRFAEVLPPGAYPPP